jgi:DNA-binding beta-propeller fold protein YncE
MRTALQRAAHLAVVAGGLISFGGLAGVAPAVASAPASSPSTIFVVNAGSDDLTPVNVSTGVAGPAVKLGELPDALAVAPGGKTVYIVEVGSDEQGSPGRVVPIATAGHALGKPIAVGANPQGIAITPDGRTAYVLNGTDAATMPESTPVTVTPIDLVTQKALAPVKVGTLPLSMTMSPNGKLLYVVDSSTSQAEQGEPTAVTPVSTTTGKAGPQVKLPQGTAPLSVSGLAFTPNSATAYAVAPTGIVPIDTATGAPGKTIGLSTATPVAIAVSPDGSTIAEVGIPITAREKSSPYGDNVTLALLSTATGAVRKVTTLGGEPGAVSWKVLFAPNGSTAYVLVTAQDPSPNSLVPSECTVIPVNLATGKPAKPIDVGDGAETMLISPDGATLYVLVVGPYHSRSPHLGPGSLVPIATATAKLGRPVPLGVLPQALVYV